MTLRTRVDLGTSNSGKSQPIYTTGGTSNSLSTILTGTGTLKTDKDSGSGSIFDYSGALSNSGITPSTSISSSIETFDMTGTDAQKKAYEISGEISVNAEITPSSFTIREPVISNSDLVNISIPKFPTNIGQVLKSVGYYGTFTISDIESYVNNAKKAMESVGYDRLQRAIRSTMRIPGYSEALMAALLLFKDENSNEKNISTARLTSYDMAASAYLLASERLTALEIYYVLSLGKESINYSSAQTRIRAAFDLFRMNVLSENSISALSMISEVYYGQYNEYMSISYSDEDNVREEFERILDEVLEDYEEPLQPELYNDIIAKENMTKTSFNNFVTLYFGEDMINESHFRIFLRINGEAALCEKHIGRMSFILNYFNGKYTSERKYVEEIMDSISDERTYLSALLANTTDAKTSKTMETGFEGFTNGILSLYYNTNSLILGTETETTFTDHELLCYHKVITDLMLAIKRSMLTID